MKPLFLFIAVLLAIFGVKIVVEWMIRKILGIDKENRPDVHLNKWHKKLHSVLNLSFFIFYFLNKSYLWIDGSLLIILYILLLFTFHALMERVVLKNSREYIVTFFTGICLAGSVSILFNYIRILI